MARLDGGGGGYGDAAERRGRDRRFLDGAAGGRGDMSVRPLGGGFRPSAGFLDGGGEMGALMRAHDWGATSLGTPDGWAQPLKTLVGVMLAAGQPMFLAFGPERLLLYNDDYGPMLADRHPRALGRPFLDVWPDARPQVERVFSGEPVHMRDIRLFLDRPGRPKEAHFAFSYTPVRDEGGEVVGLFCPCLETTEQVAAEREQVREAEAPAPAAAADAGLRRRAVRSDACL